MEKFNYYFNTRQRIDMVLNGPINKATMPSVIFNLVWDIYYNISTDEKVIVKAVEQWMDGKTSIFHPSVYTKDIKKAIKTVKKMPWRNIQETIKVRQSELDYIASFNDIKKEKLLFCYLAVAKFMDMSRSTPTHWESEKDTTIFKMARVNVPSAERDYYINEMINGEPHALIHFAYSNDDNSKRIDYISDDVNDPVVIELDESSYYELAFTYLNWKNNGGYKKCAKCGRLFRVQGNVVGKNDKDKRMQSNNALYCRDCKSVNDLKYKGKDVSALDYDPKKIQCIDCGEVVYIDNYKNNTTCRCESCQNEANKLSKREWKRRQNDG